MIEIKRKQPAQQPAGRSELPSGAPETQTRINAQNGARRQLQPFTGHDGRNYRTAYRAVCDFHERHNPPRIEADGSSEYWRETAEDMEAVAAQFDCDQFVMKMLLDVYEELEREYAIIGSHHDKVQAESR